MYLKGTRVVQKSGLPKDLDLLTKLPLGEHHLKGYCTGGKPAEVYGTQLREDTHCLS